MRRALSPVQDGWHFSLARILRGVDCTMSCSVPGPELEGDMGCHRIFFFCTRTESDIERKSSSVGLLTGIQIPYSIPPVVGRSVFQKNICSGFHRPTDPIPSKKRRQYIVFPCPSACLPARFWSEAGETMGRKRRLSLLFYPRTTRQECCSSSIVS
jgi:hypothetical protein